MIIYGSGKTGRIHRNVQPSITKEKVGPTRVCRLCGKEKPLTAYAKSAKLKLGRQYECKACVKERWHKKHGKGGNKGTPCIVKDLETGEEARYSSVVKAAAVIGCSRTMVSDRLQGRIKRPTIYGRYEVRRDDEQG